MSRILGISSSFFGKRKVERQEWEHLYQLGFRYAEIALQSCDRSVEEFQEFIQENAQGAKAAGLTLWSLHLPYGWKTDITMESDSCMEILKKLMDCGRNMGFQIFVLHASFEPIKDNREQRIQIGNKNIRELAKYANSLGMELAVECLPRTCIGNTGEECERLIAGTDAGICMDINHLFQETPKAFIERLGHKIITTHISDNDGIDERHRVPGEGTLDFVEAFQALDAVNLEIPLIFEVRSKSELYPEDILKGYQNIGKEYIGVVELRSQRVLMYDILDMEHPIWEWNTEPGRLGYASDLKLRCHKEYGNVVLVCDSRGFAAMIRYSNGEILWKTWAKGNLHSIELLPDGRVALAASTGGFLRIYSDEDIFIETVLKEAHGVLYDPERGTLWGLGEHTLAEYDTKTLHQTGQIYDFGQEIGCGHDLAPYYGDKNLLWVTTEGGVWVYNKKENRFMRDHPMTKRIATENVKGIGNTPYTNQVFYVFQNGALNSWNTDEIWHLDEKGKSVIARKDHIYYKIRVMCNRYQ